MKEVELKRIPFDPDNVLYESPIKHVSAVPLERYYSKSEAIELIKKYYNQGHSDAGQGMIRFGTYFEELFKDKDCE